MCLKQLDTGILNKRTYDARDQFEDLFAALLSTRALPDQNTPDITASEQLSNREANQLQTLGQSHSKSLMALPRDSRYSRHVIGTDGTWIGFICRWEPYASSSVHGHPSFAYYQVLEGEFSMNLYATSDAGEATHTHTKQMTNGDCIWKHGKSGCYDNFVHKVSTSNTGGFTLHLFSEDPARGEHFTTV